MTNANTKTLTFATPAIYLWVAAFVAGNVLLPQFCHMVNLGGKVFLPIMFFTLIAAARFGLRSGLMTAVISPLISMALFGMPSGIMLAAVILKSALIAGLIGWWAQSGRRFSIPSIVMLIAGIQLAGFVIEGALFFGYATSWNDLLISWPGTLIQMVVLWAVTRK